MSKMYEVRRGNCTCEVCKGDFETGFDCICGCRPLTGKRIVELKIGLSTGEKMRSIIKGMVRHTGRETPPSRPRVLFNGAEREVEKIVTKNKKEKDINAIPPLPSSFTKKNAEDWENHIFEFFPPNPLFTHKNVKWTPDKLKDMNTMEPPRVCSKDKPNQLPDWVWDSDVSFASDEDPEYNDIDDTIEKFLERKARFHDKK